MADVQVGAKVEVDIQGGEVVVQGGGEVEVHGGGEVEHGVEVKAKPKAGKKRAASGKEKANGAVSGGAKKSAAKRVRTSKPKDPTKSISGKKVKSAIAEQKKMKECIMQIRKTADQHFKQESALTPQDFVSQLKSLEQSINQVIQDCIKQNQQAVIEQ